MGLRLRVKVDKRKSGVEARWIYLPKALYELLNRPSSFEVELEDGKLILTPLKEGEEVKTND